MNMKIMCAFSAAVVTALSAAACGSSAAKDESSESFVPTENIEVEKTDQIDEIPEGADNELVFIGIADINPSKANPEKSTELTLFEDKGGKMGFHRTTFFGQYDDLAACVMANKDVPDIFNLNWESFPNLALRGMAQPIDDIVNFDDPLWTDVKDDADQYMLGGRHYVAPLDFDVASMIVYDSDLVDAEGLEDPYELYINGEWTQEKWAEIMREFVGNATGDTVRYGINGYYKPQMVESTGKTLVNFDRETNTFSSNLMDPDIESVENMLYDLNKEGLLNNEWIGNAREAFKANCLFYAMGAWGYSANNGPDEDDNWRVVPIPAYTKDPQKITSSNTKSYLWIKGSTKNEAMKCWFECCRLAYTDPEYKEVSRQKFMENSPYWTDEMYDVMMDVNGPDYFKIFDYCYGLDNATGDPNAYNGIIAFTDVLYKESSQPNVEGEQKTWAQIREEHSATLDSVIKDVNENIKKLPNE